MTPADRSEIFRASAAGIECRITTAQLVVFATPIRLEANTLLFRLRGGGQQRLELGAILGVKALDGGTR